MRDLTIRTVFFCTMFFCWPDTANAVSWFDARAIPPGDIEFDIERNGEIVGSHVVQFSETGTGIQVESQSRIEIPFLWFTAYDFRYRSIAGWDENGLLSLMVEADDDGEIFSMTVERTDGVFTVETSQDRYTVTGKLFPTNHWNPGVLDESRVLNTLTGKIDAVTIREAGREQVKTEKGLIDATRYDYSGDLEVSVWYDDRRRWVRIQFAGRDGSLINYICRRCQGDGLESLPQ